MNVDELIILLQRLLENNPLVVLGSGASIDYGLPSMADLAKEICRHSHHDVAFADLCAKLASGMDLESAINDCSLPDDVFCFVQNIVWDCVCSSDYQYFTVIDHNNATIQLVKKLLRPSGNKCTIVTTNYDRIVEYAVDIAGATIVTGFEGSLIKKFETVAPNKKIERVRARNKTVELWKVHGSLDWFTSTTNEVLSYPLSKEILTGHRPLIIPPGNEKMRLSHNEPYRTTIAEADKSIIKAGAYLCVGYGFNDEHIQSKIIDEIQKGKPIVVLARTMTCRCRELIVNNSNVQKYLILEKNPSGDTLATYHGGSLSVPGNLWQLSEFLEKW